MSGATDFEMVTSNPARLIAVATARKNVVREGLLAFTVYNPLVTAESGKMSGRRGAPPAIELTTVPVAHADRVPMSAGIGARTSTPTPAWALTPSCVLPASSGIRNFPIGADELADSVN